MNERKAPEVQVFSIYIQASAEKVFDAITTPEFSDRYGYGGAVTYDLVPGGEYRSDTTEEMREMGMGDVAVTGQVIEVDRPHRLVHTWVAAWTNEPTTLTWELTEFNGPLTRVVLTHDCTGAPTRRSASRAWAMPTRVAAAGRGCCRASRRCSRPTRRWSAPAAEPGSTPHVPGSVASSRQTLELCCR
ncbi:SRPBCC domain-containing protein [Aestuariimicrobium ganziense]|uniref:SRPBCC domain-containing protein n=1 Tax=Aestuariimicrobium ganziense TaxID=2773677 RepID=UPI0019418E30|nr:SRPBCC domain-containing protein [Aestuariimicrobium ganziense]